MIKLVCFDLDGVLVDTADWHYQAFNDAMKFVTHGDFIKEEEQRTTFNGHPTPVKLIKLMAQGRIDLWQADDIANLKHRLFKDRVRNDMEPRLEKIELVLGLKDAGYKTTVVSNCNAGNTQLLLYHLQLLDLVDYWVSADDVSRPKPAPDGYVKVMNLFSSTPNETIIFEDSPVGLEAAAASKAHIAVVRECSDLTIQFAFDKIRKAQALSG